METSLFEQLLDSMLSIGGVSLGLLRSVPAPATGDSLLNPVLCDLVLDIVLECAGKVTDETERGTAEAFGAVLVGPTGLKERKNTRSVGEHDTGYIKVEFFISTKGNKIDSPSESLKPFMIPIKASTIDSLIVCTKSIIASSPAGAEVDPA